MITMITTCPLCNNQLDDIKNGNVTRWKQHIEQHLVVYGISTLAKQAWKHFNTIDCPLKKKPLHLPAHIYRIKTNVKCRNICHNNIKATTIDDMLEAMKVVVAKTVQRLSKLHNKHSRLYISNMYPFTPVWRVDMQNPEYCFIYDISCQNAFNC